RIERGKLNAMLGICETTTCRRQAILAHFGESHEGNCGNCDTCRSPVATWDGTDAAVKALAAIYRTGQRFGAGHIIDVLLGKETEKVTRFGHQNQKVFGAGKDHDSRTWQSVLRQLTAAGFIVIDHEAHGALMLSEEARPVFRGERKVTFRQDRPRKAAEVRRSLNATVFDLPPEAAGLFDALRNERLRLAKLQGVPPYVVFHDTTLRAMALTRPGSFDDLRAIPGIGHSKLERYGEAFLSVIASHAA
ncbi:MAG: HRDC domain-containing protein, partial [Devosia nanyangense]|nr:HRDC domain-containing protein [Devosia nanyangense]